MITTESGVTVALQGTTGAYSHLAATELFPGGRFLFFRTFSAVARAVEQGLCRYGILPIENNTYGSVKAVYKLLREERVYIKAAFRQRIDHVLLGTEGSSLHGIRRIFSHEQALGQCASFINSLGDRVEVSAALNTALAARYVSESDDDSYAAIASPQCADMYGLRILKRNIADSDHNFTRFLVVSASREETEEPDRASMIFSIAHRPGELARVLDRFAENGINLLKIESMPVPGKDFEFEFYVDIDISGQSQGTGVIIDYMERICPDFRFLGSYPEYRGAAGQSLI